DDEADEGDRASGRDRGRRPERGRDDDDEPDPAHRDAQARHLVLPDHQRVEQAAVQEDHDRAQHDVGEDEQDAVPSGRDEPAQDPRVRLPDRLRVRLLHVGLDRVEEGGDRDPGQDEPGGRAEAADRPAEDVGARRTVPGAMCTGPTRTPIPQASTTAATPPAAHSLGSRGRPPRTAGRAPALAPSTQAACVSISCKRPATACMKSMTRGPHREAMSSSTPTTCPDLTALMALQPGRAATVSRFWLQHFVSARTMRSGFELTMYSADSCG